MRRPFKFSIASVALTLLLLSLGQGTRAETTMLVAFWAVSSILSIGVAAFPDRFRVASLLCFLLPFLGLLVGFLILNLI
jgi:hypothetical protein